MIGGVRMHLTLIKGIKKEKPDYYMMYSNAYINCLERIISYNQLVRNVSLIERQRIVYYGVNLINYQGKNDSSYDQLIKKLSQIDFIKAVISTLTPDEFENIFPIDKSYDGDRYQTKDYFFTRKSLDEMGRDKEIGEHVEDLFWDYQNHKVREFSVNGFSVLSDIRRSQGHKGILEEFFEEKGLPTYKVYKDEKGKEFLENSLSGEVSEVKRPKPRYLNLVK